MNDLPFAINPIILSIVAHASARAQPQPHIH
jgi:hypothetical protein